MDLIDRYLVAVGRQLPAALQDDIIQELGDSLRSEAEEHERTSGHPLTAGEQAALLKKRGHPWLMASRYLPQQQLIGPALFPYYRQALKIVVFWVVLPITLFGGAISAIYSADSSMVWGRVLGAAWNGAIYSVGLVTIVFAILDHEKLRITVLDNWNPANLPEPKAGRAIPRSETVMGLVFALTFLVWWTDLVRVPEFAFFDGDPVRFVPAPIWRELYFPILVSLVASIGVYLIDLVRPWRTLAVSAVDLAIGLLNIFIVTRILRAGHYLDVFAGGPEDGAKLAQVSYWFNTIIQWVFITVGVATIVEVLYELWRMLKARGARALAL
jgi:hypothetical protein